MEEVQSSWMIESSILDRANDKGEGAEEEEEKEATKKKERGEEEGTRVQRYDESAGPPR